jgi:hypothetical protein
MIFYNSKLFHTILILEAVRCKFKLPWKQMEVEWPNIHDAILNKRRNWKKEINSPTTRKVITSIQNLNVSI